MKQGEKRISWYRVVLGIIVGGIAIAIVLLKFFLYGFIGGYDWVYLINEVIPDTVFFLLTPVYYLFVFPILWLVRILMIDYVNESGIGVVFIGVDLVITVALIFVLVELAKLMKRFVTRRGLVDK